MSGSLYPPGNLLDFLQVGRERAGRDGLGADDIVIQPRASRNSSTLVVAAATRVGTDVNVDFAPVQSVTVRMP